MKLIFKALFIIQILFFCSNFTQLYSQATITKENRKFQKEANKYYNKGEKDNALSNYKKVIQQNAVRSIEFLESYINYCEIMVERENYDEAVEQCEVALELIEERIEELETNEDKKGKEKKEIANLKEKKSLYNNYLNNYFDLRLEHSKERQREQDRINGQNNYSANVKGYDFSNKDFVTRLLGLPKGENEDKLKRINEIVIEELAQKKKDKSLEVKLYPEIIALNTWWAKKVKYKQYDWLDDLTELDSYYRDRIEDYNNLINKKDSITRVKVIIDRDIELDDNKIRIYKEKINNSIKIRDKTLFDELKSKLYTIPQSLVIIGRIKIDGFYDNEKNNLFTEMQNGAISEISSLDIFHRLSMYNDSIKSFYSIEKKGYAQTTDKYYTSITNYLSGESTAIEIYRIEVFPFDVPKEDERKLTTNIPEYVPDSLSIDVYKYDDDNLERLSDRKPFPLNDQEMFGFSSEEIDFIHQIDNYSKEFNAMYDDKIKNAFKTYNYRYNKINDEIEEYEKILSDLNLKKSEKIVNSSKQQIEIEKIESQDISKNEKECKKAKKVYEDFYEDKFHNVNHIAVRSLNVLKADDSEGFKKLAEICFNTISESIKSQYTKTTVSKEVMDEKSRIVLQQETIEYDLIIDSLRIISLNVYRVGKESYLALNLAFKIRWESLGFEKPDLTLENILTEEIEKTSEPKPVLGELQNENEQVETETLIEKEPVISPISSHEEKPAAEPEMVPTFDWDIPYDKKMSIGYYFSEKKQDGWRLPTIDELDKIFNCTECKKRINRALFKKNDWIIQESEIAFVSNLSEYDYGAGRTVYKCYLIKDENYNRELINKKNNKYVWIILIKE